MDSVSPRTDQTVSRINEAIEECGFYEPSRRGVKTIHRYRDGTVGLEMRWMGICWLSMEFFSIDRLTRLDISHNHLSDKFVMLIANNINQSNLRRLNLHGNWFEDDGLASILNALSENTTLESVVLSTTSRGEDFYTVSPPSDNIVLAMKTFLMGNKTLEKLYIEGRGIPYIIDLIADELRYNKTLNTMNMEEFPPDISKNVARVLSESSITSIGLPHLRSTEIKVALNA